MTSAEPRPEGLPQYETIIVGSGFSGIGMGIALRKAGRHDFLILEKAADLGGTWRENHYPGAACDVPSNMYSYSFEPNPGWSRTYSPQAEILAYIRGCADKYGVTPHLRYNSELIEARWDDAAQLWRLATRNGDRYTCRFLVSGIGGLSRPALPKVKGLEKFKGAMFHSADWNHDVDLTGKRVAVIGTGASAIQFVPQIQPKVGKLVLLQRTPPWIIPKVDVAIDDRVQQLFRRLPLAQRLARNSIYWISETFGLGFVNPKLMFGVEAWAKKHLKDQVPDPVLRNKLTPRYAVGCKRVLFSNNYYPALTQPNVEVVAAGVKEVTADSVVDANGEQHQVDVVICGTGFDVQDPLGPLHVYDENGRELRERGSMSAYLGIMVPKLPNCFFLLGPNTGLGHNSIIFMIEAQIDYIMKCLQEMDRRGAGAIEVSEHAAREFNEDIQRQLKKMVWSAGGCSSWYLNEKGENNTLWPGFTWKYWLRTRSPEFAHFHLSPRKVKQVA
ncbi:MAG: NAD(P)/FAD-dependent oxidoreductase [Moraxellaceae bacterium]|jgi:cation diffusion facilitator CzcD-associated flavoprotein CzcO|nr:NAD(P)/FAD-dependent oxidoreductase [Moraxellaceae bacterium]